jgi:selenide,water dikinase
MAAASNVTIAIDLNELPIIPGVLEIAAANKSGGMNTNKAHFASGIEFSSGEANASTDAPRRDLIFDPQTSGGLLVAVAASSADRVLADLTGKGIQAVSIGTVEVATGFRLKFG